MTERMEGSVYLTFQAENGDRCFATWMGGKIVIFRFPRRQSSEAQIAPEKAIELKPFEVKPSTPFEIIIKPRPPTPPRLKD